ncbi:transglutaminase-like cysteine peptidase [Acetobacteraceae bacterium]|nr:transglutaminase-like cysteine peptidase [Candidatus Parcubacteria bacterium]
MSLKSSTTALLLMVMATSAPVEAKRFVPVFGASRFCVRHPGQCTPQGAESIVITKEIRARIESVNKEVNRRITPVEETRANNADVWRYNVTAGDCEDYALTKRFELDKFLPRSALRIATGKTPRGTDHAVLIVVTDQGNLVLDSRNDEITTVGKSPYHFEGMMSANPKIWESM